MIKMQSTLEKTIEIRESTSLEIVEILNKALQLNIEQDDLDPDTPLFGSGLGLDSVDAVVFIVELESTFNIRISEKEGMEALRTVNSTIDLIISKSNEDD